MHAIQPQNFKRHTDSQWPRIDCNQRTIKITPAVPDPEAHLVKTNHWDDQRTDRYRVGIVGNRDAISTDFHRRVTPPFAKPQRFVFVHYLRKRKRRTSRLNKTHHWTGIIFAAMRPAESHYAFL